jgi:3-hydroxybutyryl-CoA dehydratase
MNDYLGKLFTSDFLFSEELIKQYGKLINDLHPLHMDSEHAANLGYDRNIAHGLLISSICSSFLATDIFDLNILVLSQNFQYRKPIYANETVSIYAKVNSYDSRFKIASTIFTIKAQGKVKCTGNISVRIT